MSSVSVARSQPTRGAVLRVMLCVKRSSRASAVDARCLFYRRLLCLKAKCWAFGQWWLTRPAVKASAEATSHRFETTKAASAPSFGFCALIGLALGPGLNWPSGWPSCPGQRPFHCHEQPPRRGTTLLDGQRSRGRPHLACWADIAAGRRPKQRCSTAAPRGGAPTRRRRSRRTATATATPS